MTPLFTRLDTSLETKLQTHIHTYETFNENETGDNSCRGQSSGKTQGRDATYGYKAYPTRML